MRRIVLTGYAGDEFARYHELTAPLIRKFASNNGCSFETVDLSGDRPASWNKIREILKVFQDYDQVLWIDADVVINPRTAADFLEDVNGEQYWHGLVLHHTPCGDVPNCGFWAMNSQMVPILEQVWREERNIDHVWWEQASILEQMGYQPRTGDCYQTHETPLSERTLYLDKRWNWHPFDAFADELPYAIHCTQASNRYEWIKSECEALH